MPAHPLGSQTLWIWILALAGVSWGALGKLVFCLPHLSRRHELGTPFTSRGWGEAWTGQLRTQAQHRARHRGGWADGIFSSFTKDPPRARVRDISDVVPAPEGLPWMNEWFTEQLIYQEPPLLHEHQGSHSGNLSLSSPRSGSRVSRAAVGGLLLRLPPLLPHCSSSQWRKTGRRVIAFVNENGPSTIHMFPTTCNFREAWRSCPTHPGSSRMRLS